MSTVGLTDARRSALALLADCRNADDFSLALQAVGRTMLRALHADKLIDDEGRPTKRGHAALAAPKMTQAEYDVLTKMAASQNKDRWVCIDGTSERITARRLDRQQWAEFDGIGWYSYGRATPSGLKALNDVRAAIGSAEWKP